MLKELYKKILGGKLGGLVVVLKAADDLEKFGKAVDALQDLLEKDLKLKKAKAKVNSKNFNTAVFNTAVSEFLKEGDWAEEFANNGESLGNAFDRLLAQRKKRAKGKKKSKPEGKSEVEMATVKTKNEKSNKKVSADEDSDSDSEEEEEKEKKEKEEGSEVEAGGTKKEAGSKKKEAGGGVDDDEKEGSESENGLGDLEFDETETETETETDGDSSKDSDSSVESSGDEYEEDEDLEEEFGQEAAEFAELVAMTKGGDEIEDEAEQRKIENFSGSRELMHGTREAYKEKLSAVQGLHDEGGEKEVVDNLYDNLFLALSDRVKTPETDNNAAINAAYKALIENRVGKGKDLGDIDDDDVQLFNNKLIDSLRKYIFEYGVKEFSGLIKVLQTAVPSVKEEPAIGDLGEILTIGQWKMIKEINGYISNILKETIVDSKAGSYEVVVKRAYSEIGDLYDKLSESDIEEIDKIIEKYLLKQENAAAAKAAVDGDEEEVEKITAKTSKYIKTFKEVIAKHKKAKTADSKGGGKKSKKVKLLEVLPEPGNLPDGYALAQQAMNQIADLMLRKNPESLSDIEDDDRGKVYNYFKKRVDLFKKNRPDLTTLSNFKAAIKIALDNEKAGLFDKFDEIYTKLKEQSKVGDFEEFESRHSSKSRGKNFGKPSSGMGLGRSESDSESDEFRPGFGGDSKGGFHGFGGAGKYRGASAKARARLGIGRNANGTDGYAEVDPRDLRTRDAVVNLEGHSTDTVILRQDPDGLNQIVAINRSYGSNDRLDQIIQNSGPKRLGNDNLEAYKSEFNLASNIEEGQTVLKKSKSSYNKIWKTYSKKDFPDIPCIVRDDNKGYKNSSSMAMKGSDINISILDAGEANSESVFHVRPLGPDGRPINYRLEIVFDGGNSIPTVTIFSGRDKQDPSQLSDMDFRLLNSFNIDINISTPSRDRDGFVEKDFVEKDFVEKYFSMAAGTLSNAIANGIGRGALKSSLKGRDPVDKSYEPAFEEKAPNLGMGPRPGNRPLGSKKSFEGKKNPYAPSPDGTAHGSGGTILG